LGSCGDKARRGRRGGLVETMLVVCVASGDKKITEPIYFKWVSEISMFTLNGFQKLNARLSLHGTRYVYLLYLTLSVYKWLPLFTFLFTIDHLSY
jgi:hypothetical protein